MTQTPNDNASNPQTATASNWRTPPFNRWAFHHVPEVLTTAPIAADQSPKAPPGRAPASLDGFRLAAPGGRVLDLPMFLKATSTDAMVVLHDGAIVFDHYDGGTTRLTPHILMSSTKAVIGLLVGVLQQAGEIDVNAPVSSYVPEIEKTAYKGASVRQLIDMRGGVTLDERQSQDYDAAVHRGPAEIGRPGLTLHAVLQTLMTAKGPHGGPFSYISANTDLVGWAIERATGQCLPSLLSERLWRPIKATSDASMIVDAEGASWCTGGLSATAEDFARLGQVLVQGGYAGDRAVVPSGWIDDLFEGGDRHAWATGEWGEAFASISRTMSYRAGWYSVPDDPRHVFAMGVHGQNLFVDRINRIVIAKLSSQPHRIDPQAIGLTHLALPEIIRCVLDGA